MRQNQSCSLALPKGTLANGVSAAERGGNATPGAHTVRELEMEISGLRTR